MTFKRVMTAAVITTLLLLIGVSFMNRAQNATQPSPHPHEQALKAEDGSWNFTNHLIDETSPYLLQHAHNPVNWHSWGEAAFEKARRENKPIFLSIGYSTCYWCHVMARKVFEDPQIAEQMNEQFVNIKVDREQRPDVDEIYMTATQLMTGSGGWPMSVFLTPPGAKGDIDRGLRPYWAGTYIPPEPAHGMAGFPQVLDALSKAWTDQRQEVNAQADQIAEAVSQALSEQAASGPVTQEMIRQAAEQVLRTYDAEHGGFGARGQGPKFPQPVNLQLLLAVHRNNQNPSIREAVDHTLERMARGGMYDQIGGGFHRYSTDQRWLVPHFEKMLYDNGQLAETYAEALEVAEKVENVGNVETAGNSEEAVVRRRRYERVLRGIGDYVLRGMTDETGAFWSAQDAEVHAREGGNYIWTAQQVRQAIDEEDLAELALEMYGLDQGTNFQDPHAPEAEPANVLYLPRPLDALAKAKNLSLDELLAKKQTIDRQLKAVRDRRDQPGTDDKVLTGWNGLMIAGLARSGRVLDEPRYVEAAAEAADAVLAHMSRDAPAKAGQGVNEANPIEGGLYRSMRHGQVAVPAFLEDYAFFIHGLVELHRARGATSAKQGAYLEQAKRLTKIVEDQFAAEGGGYYDTRAEQDDLFVRTRSKFDGALPTGNSVMMHNRIDLYQLTDDRAYLEGAATDLRSFAGPMDSQGIGMVHMLQAALRLLAIDQNLLAKGAPSGQGQHADQPVRAEATWADSQTLELILHIDEQYHLNAHDVAGEGLIPTQVTLANPDSGKIEVTYPEGRHRTYPFADGPLRVYEGKLTLRIDAKLLNEDTSLVLTYQACTQTSCLPPDTRQIEVPAK